MKLGHLFVSLVSLFFNLSLAEVSHSKTFDSQTLKESVFGQSTDFEIGVSESVAQDLNYRDGVALEDAAVAFEKAQCTYSSASEKKAINSAKKSKLKFSVIDQIKYWHTPTKSKPPVYHHRVLITFGSNSTSRDFHKIFCEKTSANLKDGFSPAEINSAFSQNSKVVTIRPKVVEPASISPVAPAPISPIAPAPVQDGSAGTL